MTTPDRVPGTEPYDTRIACGSVESPKAGAVITSIKIDTDTSNYRVHVIWGYGDTEESTTADNFVILVDKTKIGKLSGTINGTPGNLHGPLELILNIDKGSTVAVAANAAGNGTYKATLAITKCPIQS